MHAFCLPHKHAGVKENLLQWSLSPATAGAASYNPSKATWKVHSVLGACWLKIVLERHSSDSWNPINVHTKVLSICLDLFMCCAFHLNQTAVFLLASPLCSMFTQCVHVLSQALFCKAKQSSFSSLLWDYFPIPFFICSLCSLCVLNSLSMANSLPLISLG